jgi:hypothetical protein
VSAKRMPKAARHINRKKNAEVHVMWEVERKEKKAT